jgi:hypothetical protein
LSQEILVDDPHDKPPIKLWLLLGAVILMLHLAALRALPLHLGGLAAPAIPMSFETRTVTNASPTPVQPEAAPDQAPTRNAPSHPTQVTPQAAKPIATEVAPESPTSVNNTQALDEAAAMARAALAESAVQAAPVPPPVSAAPRQLKEAAASLHTGVVPASVKLVYEVQTNKFPYSLNGELVWASADGRYQASLMVGAFGQKRIQTSRGQIGEGGLMPERFSDKYRSELAAHFNRQKGKVTFSANTPDAPLLAGAQDRLSVLIQLAALVASAPERFAPATTLSIQTIGPREADLWLFTVGGTETLVLPGGTLEVLKLTRNPHQTYDQQMDVWLAPNLGYLPARIRITEASGDYIDQKWLRSEPVPTP